MDKIVLVVGEVTRNQYQPARCGILRDASTPQLKRVEPDELFMPDLMLDRIYKDRARLQELLSAGNDHHLDQQSQDPLDSYYCELARKHLLSFGHVRAVVVQEDLLTGSYNSVVKLLLETPELATLWRARPDGSVLKCN